MSYISTIRGLLFLISTLLFGGAQAHGAADKIRQETEIFKLGLTEMVQYRLTSTDGRTIEYFISKPKVPSPLVLFIQGSGCTPVFIGLQLIALPPYFHIYL